MNLRSAHSRPLLIESAAPTLVVELSAALCLHTQTASDITSSFLPQIASKVELHVANLPSSGDASQAAWRKLGSMTFDSNERSSFKARELKSVHVEAGAQLLKVVFHRPHANRLNTHSQVNAVLAGP